MESQVCRGSRMAQCIGGSLSEPDSWDFPVNKYLMLLTFSALGPLLCTSKGFTSELIIALHICLIVVIIVSDTTVWYSLCH